MSGINSTVIVQNLKTNSGRVFYLENSGSPISDFKVKYHFTTENGKTPVLSDWDTPNASVHMEHISGDNWAVVFDFSGFTLTTGGMPNETRCSIGLSYQDGSEWNKDNDPSNNMSSNFAVNLDIEVFDSNGNRIN